MAVVGSHGTVAEKPSREELLVRAERLVPVLRERSARAESLGRVPDETIADLSASGLLRICRPARYGGYELGWDVLCEVSQTLARGCGSQAWVQNIFNDHAQKVSTFALEAQDEVWGADPEARIGASFDPVGRARPAAGGVVWSGRHGFSSGIDHAQWLLCGGQLAAEDRPPQRCYVLLRKSEVQVIDDWDVVGLGGTGSKSFIAADVFVPAHRVLGAEDWDEGTGPGLQINTAPISRLPRGGITSTGFAAVGVGVAEGFLTEYLAYTRPRQSRGTPVAAQAGTQIATGAASAAIAAAATIYLAPAREAMRQLERGETVSAELRSRAKRDSAYACQIALAACTQLFVAAGGRALYRSGSMQRQIRDLIAVSGHHSLVWDNVAAEYGRRLLEI